VRTILLVTTADTEILAAAGAATRLRDHDETAAFPAVRARNPARAPQDGDGLDRWLDDALDEVVVVAVRLLGGRAAFPQLFERLRDRCVAGGVPFLAFSGEDAPDAQLTEASTAPTAVLAEAFEYLRRGGVDNTEQLLRFVADTLLRDGFGFTPPVDLPEDGLWHPDHDDTDGLIAAIDPDRPTVGVVFYRSHLTSGNTDFVAALLRSIEARGANAVGLFCYSLRSDEAGHVAVLELVDRHGLTLDGLVTTVLAMGGANAADAEHWSVPALDRLDVPVIQALTATSSRARWDASDIGLSPLDTAMQIAMPEFDGRVVAVPFSFKEQTDDDSIVGGPLVRYVADPERTERVAGLAVNHARLRHRDNADKRIALVLSNYPTRHSRIGNGVGLDTPASVCALLRAMLDAGYDLGELGSGGDADRFLTDSDALIHALVEAGGFDQAHLTEAQLAGAEARLPTTSYAEWFAELPADLRADVEEHWGRPPGDVLVTSDGSALVAATLRFGNVVLAIQPPRGFGENTVAIYHDPDLPPTHHYLAAYWWLTRRFGADAIVHVGKHGTLEWLPGKGVGMSASCAPDAALTDVPLVYPFVVNDPGEGTQAKRRAHATIVDHLVPPMMRAETYDELAQLEQLLDEYAEIELLDPSKLAAIRDQVWELLVTADIAIQLGVETMPEDLDDFGALITHVDGYLCEIKDLQVRDGLHVLGAPPEDEQLRGLTKAVLRLPQTVAGRQVPGLRASVAAAFGLDEQTLLVHGGEPVGSDAAVGTGEPDLAAVSARTRGPMRTRGDVLDRIEELTDRLVGEVAAKAWSTDDVDTVVADVLGRPAATVAEVLRVACDEVVPRIRASDREVGSVLRVLDGRYLPAGPSGSPTRGRLDVLPTGRNFYSVDPRGLPSQVSWQVGRQLAADLIRRHREDEGRVPTSVGIVVWGTANMRTHGDDIAEILALFGVRPTWHTETRRVTGLEVIDLDALGRPRVDVTVRISGFFRDAFPHLIGLLDDAVAMVAGLDEPDEMNPVAANVRSDRDRLTAAGVAPEQAARRARTRVFGAKPGAYGAGLLPLIDARNWRDTDDLAEVYTVWSGYGYGRGLDGVPAREDMQASFARVQVAVKNTDTREHDILDSDDYFQEHGGMVATIRSLTGRAPLAYIGDSSDPSRPATRSLKEETDRVFRSRVVNPRWIAAMQRHGYKGAFELSATVDYLFGYDATAGVVDDWQYEQVSRRYVMDDETRAFLERSNPWALQAIAERLLEAAQRGLWEQPDPDTLAALRATYLDVDADLEERT
jgi:cobaltochelatase CobN